ncbi:MAG: phosphoribosyltransferase [Candidatus Methanoplasma sp.]|nr:phosphoribosyltransferase [Candidatus Methanoplasma sp.]
MSGDVDCEGGLDENVDYDTFKKVYERIVSYTSGLLEKYKPQVIILVQRKGRRIFQDVFNYNEDLTKNVHIHLDTTFTDDDVYGKNVLILDDSMKQGKSVGEVISHFSKQLWPKTITVATIITNQQVIESKKASWKEIEVEALYTCPDYDAQKEHYWGKWMKSLVHGVSIKYGIGHVSTEIRFDPNVSIGTI